MTFGPRIADDAPVRIRARGAGVAGALALGALAHSGPLHAADFEVSGSSVGQFYEVGSPWGYELERRRFLQTLGFSVYHLQGEREPGKPDYNLRVLMRLDTDFGLGQHLSSDLRSAEDTYSTAGGGRFVP